VTGAGLPLPVAMLVALLSVGLVAVVMQRLTIAPVKKMTTLTSIILTLGVSTALKALMLLIYGPEARGLPALPGSNFVVAGVSIRAQDLWILAITLVVAGAVVFFYDRTVLGKAMRACAEQPVAARLVGISPRKATTLAFLIAGLLGAVAGLLASPISLTQWDSGLTLGLKGFVAATLGGLVSIRAAVLGGLVLGVLEALVAGYIDSGYRDAVAFVLLIVVLVARPGGVFSRQAQARV
jgi:branched-chain amino acid transport system permease protein